MGNRGETAEHLLRLGEDLRVAAGAVLAASVELVEMAEGFVVGEPVSPPFPFVDMIDQIPVNPDPTSPEAWWVREDSEIKGITIHHTLSNSPVETARYVINKKGRPTLPYHFWVHRSGECWLCVPLHLGMWHDHTGHENVNVSIGLAGSLHLARPQLAQAQAAANLVVWLMEEYGIPLIEVQGHKDRASVGTVCPGWDAMGWKSWFIGFVMEGLGYDPFLGNDSAGAAPGTGAESFVL